MLRLGLCGNQKETIDWFFHGGTIEGVVLYKRWFALVRQFFLLRFEGIFEDVVLMEPVEGYIWRVCVCVCVFGFPLLELV